MNATDSPRSGWNWTKRITVELQLAARTKGGRLRGQQPEPAAAAIEADESEEVEISSTYREVSREFASMANGRVMASVTDRSTGRVISQSMGFVGPLKGTQDGGLMLAFEGDTLTEIIISEKIYCKGNAWNGGVWLQTESLEIRIDKLSDEILG